jgi:hypothetical protein
VPAKVGEAGGRQASKSKRSFPLVRHSTNASIVGRPCAHESSSLDLHRLNYSRALPRRQSRLQLTCERHRGHTAPLSRAPTQRRWAIGRNMAANIRAIAAAASAVQLEAALTPRRTAVFRTVAAMPGLGVRAARIRAGLVAIEARVIGAAVEARRAGDARAGLPVFAHEVPGPIVSWRGDDVVVLASGAAAVTRRRVPVVACLYFCELTVSTNGLRVTAERQHQPRHDDDAKRAAMGPALP